MPLRLAGVHIIPPANGACAAILARGAATDRRAGSGAAASTRSRGKKASWRGPWRKAAARATFSGHTIKSLFAAPR
jgi:hypothetical protein